MITEEHLRSALVTDRFVKLRTQEKGDGGNTKSSSLCDKACLVRFGPTSMFLMGTGRRGSDKTGTEVKECINSLPCPW